MSSINEMIINLIKGFEIDSYTSTSNLYSKTVDHELIMTDIFIDEEELADTVNRWTNYFGIQLIGKGEYNDKYIRGFVYELMDEDGDTLTIYIER